MIARRAMELLAFTMAALALAACASDQPKLTGAQCDINSECAAPLVCRLARCRRECTTSRDCMLGFSCIFDQRGLGVCQTESEIECTASSECVTGLVCHNERCVNACEEDRDCIPGQRCAVATNGNACVDPVDQPCALPSDCPAPLMCATDNQCREQCVKSRDCRPGQECVSDAMGRKVCMRTARDGGIDGSVDASLDGGRDAAGDRTFPDGGDADLPDLQADSNDEGMTLVPDASDLGLDAGQDLGIDGGQDLGMDAGTDLGMDLAIDFGTDFGTDFGADSGMDLAIDFGTDSGADLGPFDAGPLRFQSGLAQISSGFSHTCTLRNGDVWCWGSNAHAELTRVGNLAGVTGNQRTAAQLVVRRATEIQAGGTSTCTRIDGDVLCWGNNDVGQLGIGSAAAMVDTPTSVVIPGGAARIRLAQAHGCAVSAAGALYCWGSNELGQLGGGATHPQRTPLLIRGSGVADVDVGAAHTCFTLMTGELLCFGQNGQGESGQSTTMSLVSAPAVVAGVAAAAGVGLGSAHSCYFVQGGNAQCFGSNASRVLGSTFMGPFTSTPQTVIKESDGTALVGVGRIEGGIYATCALVPNLDVATPYCWSTASGQTSVGVTGTHSRAVPIPITGCSVVDLSVGEYHTCALCRSGSAFCWGRGSSGQLGDGTTTTNQILPVQVMGLP